MEQNTFHYSAFPSLHPFCFLKLCYSSCFEFFHSSNLLMLPECSLQKRIANCSRSRIFYLSKRNEASYFRFRDSNDFFGRWLFFSCDDFFWQPLMAFHIPCLTASEPLFLTLSSLNNDYFIMLLCFLLCWKGFIFDDVSFFVVALILSLFFVVYWKYEYKEKLWELVKDFLIYK